MLRKNRGNNLHQSGSTFQVGRTKMKKNIAGNYFEVGSEPVQSGFHTYYGHDWNLTMLSVPPLESNIKKLWHHNFNHGKPMLKSRKTHPKSSRSQMQSMDPPLEDVLASGRLTPLSLRSFSSSWRWSFSSLLQTTKIESREPTPTTTKMGFLR